MADEIHVIGKLGHEAEWGDEKQVGAVIVRVCQFDGCDEVKFVKRIPAENVPRYGVGLVGII